MTDENEGREMNWTNSYFEFFMHFIVTRQKLMKFEYLWGENVKLKSYGQMKLSSGN
jgi:hypothetical protein